MNWKTENKIWEDISASSHLLLRRGRIHSIKEQLYVSKGPKGAIGDVCEVGTKKVLCEIVAIENGNNILLPYVVSEKISPGDEVKIVSQTVEIPVRLNLLGKVLNANGDVINQEYNLSTEDAWLDSVPINAFEREEITDVLETGIKAIDGLLTIGIGQKIGIMAGSGVGKSTLLGMITKNSKADIFVIGLVGERGREVKDFIRKELGEEGLKRSVLVVATSDESHLMQMRAAKLATSIAEKFRDEGNNVVLMMDSVTRFADARRGIDLAVKDYPIGGKTLLMESYMKRLLERSGKTKKGSITGIYTVLVDADDMNGAIPDLARGILDGHIVLSRELASLNHYPSIDVLQSVSRIMEDIVSPEQWGTANKIRNLLSLYRKNETFFTLGTITENQDNKHIFVAKRKYEFINNFLRQQRQENIPYSDTLSKMQSLISDMD